MVFLSPPSCSFQVVSETKMKTAYLRGIGYVLEDIMTRGVSRSVWNPIVELTYSRLNSRVRLDWLNCPSKILEV